METRAQASQLRVRDFEERYIVQLRTPLDQLDRKVDEIALAVRGIRGRAWQIINGFEVAGLTLSRLQELQRRPEVYRVERSYDQVVTVSQNVGGNPYLWGLDRIDQRSIAVDGIFNYFYSGTGRKIYIVDSGIYPHAAFDYCISVRCAPGVSTIGPWWDPGNPYEDPFGHGTIVASVAAGNVTGVAKTATLVSVRVVRIEDDTLGLADPGDIVERLQWIANQGSQPRAVVNYSLSPKPNNTFNSAVIQALNNLALGYTVVVGAGNWDQDACIQGRDQFDPNILVVGAINFGLQRAVFVDGASNFGPCVDLFAPGSYIATAFSPGAVIQHNPAEGTSIAAPFVAGVAAAIAQQRPSAQPWEIPHIIWNTATDDVLYSPTLGSGSPNKLLNSLHRWVWVEGPSVVYSVPNSTSATWNAVPIGGDGNWSYVWEASVDGSPWTVVSTGASYTRYILKFSDYELRLRITGASFGENAPVLPPMIVTVTCGGC